MARIRIGTSGWAYQSWRGRFFPKEVMVRDHLRYYATRFDTTELNGVFYRTPTLEAVKNWVAQTPDDFVFAWKASKFITHWKRLSSKSRNSLALMETRLRVLGRKAGPVLFQLPPMMSANRERLASFLKMLRKKRRYAFEFRHPSWYEDEILDLLRDNDIPLPIAMLPRLGSSPRATSMCAATARAVTIAGIIPIGSCATGRALSRNGRNSAARFMSISTTTRKARRRPMLRD